MSLATLAPEALRGLPEPLMDAQRAIRLPEVQEMMARLAQYNLGVFMPHMHDLDTGAFEVMPEGMTQVEDGLRVSFESTEATETDARTFVETAWVWSGGVNPRALCNSKCVALGSMHSTGS